MKRYEKRYVTIDGYKVEFYFWGDEITPAVKVSVVKEKRGWFFSSQIAVYSESHSMNEIKSITETARQVVDNHKNELAKWN